MIIFLAIFGDLQNMKVENLKRNFHILDNCVDFGDLLFKKGISNRIFNIYIFHKLVKIHHQFLFFLITAQPSPPQLNLFPSPFHSELCVCVCVGAHSAFYKTNG